MGIEELRVSLDSIDYLLLPLFALLDVALLDLGRQLGNRPDG